MKIILKIQIKLHGSKLNEIFFSSMNGINSRLYIMKENFSEEKGIEIKKISKRKLRDKKRINRNDQLSVK
jgi:hypothetical protein